MISRAYIMMASPAGRVVKVASPVGGCRVVRDDVVVLLEGAPNGGHEPAGSGENVREVHVLEVRLRVTPGGVFWWGDLCAGSQERGHISRRVRARFKK